MRTPWWGAGVPAPSRLPVALHHSLRTGVPSQVVGRRPAADGHAVAVGPSARNALLAITGSSMADRALDGLGMFR